MVGTKIAEKISNMLVDTADKLKGGFCVIWSMNEPDVDPEILLEKEV